jgi:hypothetical protein
VAPPAVDKQNASNDRGVQQMLAQDRRVTLRLMAEELDISKDTVHTIVREDLGSKNV